MIALQTLIVVTLVGVGFLLLDRWQTAFAGQSHAAALLLDAGTRSEAARRSLAREVARLTDELNGAERDLEEIKRNPTVAARKVNDDRDRMAMEFDRVSAERDRAASQCDQLARELAAEGDRSKRELAGERDRFAREIAAERDRFGREFAAEREFADYGRAAKQAADAAQRDRWTRGASMQEVLRLQGTPSEVSRNDSLGWETWHFGINRVKFVDGVVTEWTNLDGGLKLR